MTANPKSKLHPADVKWLKNAQACHEAKEWVGQFKSLYEAWPRCEDTTWLVFALREFGAKLPEHSDSMVDCPACDFMEQPASAIRKAFPNPFPIRRAVRATPKRAAKTAKGVKK